MAKGSSPVSAVAERYATALYELVHETGSVDEALKGTEQFAQMIASSPDLQRLVKSPVFSAEDQLRAVTALLQKAGITGVVANFVRLAAKNRRLFAVPDMIKEFRQLVARRRGETSAEVTSAEPLSDIHIAALKQALADKLGKDVDLQRKVDPSLIGGLVVRVGSRMIDTSLKTKLNSLKLAMKEVR